MSTYFWFGGAATPYLVEESTRFDESNISRAPLDTDPYQPGQSAEIITEGTQWVSSNTITDVDQTPDGPYIGVDINSGFSPGYYPGMGQIVSSAETYYGRMWLTSWSGGANAYVLYSDDGGTTWLDGAPANGGAPLGKTDIQCQALNPDTNTLIIAGGQGKGRRNVGLTPNGWTGPYIQIGPTNNQVHGLAYGNGVWIAAGISTAAWYSTDDGLTWVSTPLPSTTTYATCRCAFGNGVFVMIGSNEFFHSYDGITWVKTEGAVNNSSKILFGGGYFWTGTQKSTDGINWTSAGRGTGSNGMVYSPKDFIWYWADPTGTDVSEIFWSSTLEPGSWISLGSPDILGYIYTLGATEGKLFASTTTGSGTSTYEQSVTKIIGRTTLTIKDGRNEAFWPGITVDNNGGDVDSGFILSSNNETITTNYNEYWSIGESVRGYGDLLNFTNPADLDSDLKTELFDAGEAVYQDSPYIATSDTVINVGVANQVPAALTSTNTITNINSGTQDWTSYANPLSSTAKVAVQFVDGGSQGPHYFATNGTEEWAYSNDGLTWTTRTTSGIVPPAGGFAWSGAYFFIATSVASTIDRVYRSASLSGPWAQVDSVAADGSPPNISSDGSGNLIVSYYNNAQSVIRYSSDHGTTWQNANTASLPPGAIQSIINSTCWSPAINGFVAVGGNGNIRISNSTGSSWTLAYLSSNQRNIISVASNDSAIVAVGGSGMVFRSTDGTSWAERVVTGSPYLTAVAAGYPDQWVASSESAAVYRSSNNGASFVIYNAVYPSPAPEWIAGNPKGGLFVAGNSSGGVPLMWTTVGSGAVLTIAGAESDGFIVGEVIDDCGVSDEWKVASIDDTEVVVYGVGTGLNVGDNICRASSYVGSINPGVTQLTLASNKDLELFIVGDEITQTNTTNIGTVGSVDVTTNTITLTDDSDFITINPVVSSVFASATCVAVGFTNDLMVVKDTVGKWATAKGKYVVGSIRRLPRYQSETDVLIDVESVSDHEIPQSAIFDGTSSYLTNTNGPTQTNVNAFTTSLWIKPSDISSSPDSEFLVWDWETTGLWCGLVRQPSTGSIYFTVQTGSGEYYTYTPDGVSSDTSAWQHIVLAVDTNQTNGNDRVKIYIDGVLQPKGPEVQMVEGQVLPINQGEMNGYIGAGKRTSGVEGHFDGYIADVQRIDGQALSPLAFGKFNPFGQWIAKDYEDPQLVGTIVSTVGDTQLTIADSSKFDLLEVGGGVGQDTGYTPETSAITNVESSGWKWIEEFPGVTPETANFPGGANIKDVTYGPNGWVFMTTNGKFAQSNDLVNWNYSDAPDNAPSSFEQVFTNGSRYIAATNGYPPDNLGRRIWANSTDGINWTMCNNQSPGYNNPYYVFGPYIYGACYGNGWYVAVGRPQRVNGQATGYWSMGIFATQNSNLTSAYTNAGDQAETGIALGNDPVETYSSVVFGKDKFVSPGERFGYIQYSKTDRPYPSGDTVNAWALAIGPNQQVAIGKGRVWYDIAYSSELDVYIVVGQAGVALKVGGTAINGSTAEIPMMWSNNGTYWQEVTFSEYQPYDSANYANRFDHVVWDPSNKVFCAISNAAALNPSAYSRDGVNWQYGSAAAVDNANHTADRWDSLSYGNGFILATTHQNDTMYSSSGGIDQELLTLTDDTDLNNLRSGDEVSRIQTYATSRTYSSDWVNVSSNPGGAFDSTCLGCSATVLPNGSWTPNGYTFSGVLEVEVSSIPTITVTGDSGSQTISGSNGGVGFEPGNGSGLYWIKFDAQENITSVEFTDVTTVYGFRLDGNYIWDGYPIVGGGTGIISGVGDSSLTIVSSGGTWYSGSTVIGPNLSPGRGEVTSLNTTNNTIDYTLMSGRFIGGQGKTANAVNTYGTHGYHLPFDPSDIGADVARSNDFTPNNITSADIVVDSPTDYGTDTGLGGEVRGNYATLVPSQPSYDTFSGGNLTVSVPAGSYGVTWSTIRLTSGKWYWEVTGTDGIRLGIDQDAPVVGVTGNGEFAYAFDTPTGNKINAATLTAYSSTTSVNEWTGVALDLDAGTISFYPEGIDGGIAFSGIPLDLTYTPSASETTYAGGAGTPEITFNFGQRPFKYQAPAGYRAVTTTNL